MKKWIIVRAVLVVLAFAQGTLSGDNWLPSRAVTPLLLVGMLFYGLLAIPVVAWAQRLNPRNRPVWRFPSWRLNPLTLRDPLQFFHMVGFVFLAAGLGVIARAVRAGTGVRLAHGVLPAFGIGMIAGTYAAAWLFRSKLEPLPQV